MVTVALGCCREVPHNTVVFAMKDLFFDLKKVAPYYIESIWPECGG